MQKIFVPRTLFAIALFGILLLVVACGGDTPTSTPVPPTANVPTALPPAPTAPPLTAAPTAVLPTATPPPPTATAVVPPTQVATTEPPPAATNTTAAAAGAASTNPTRKATLSAPAAAAANVDRGALNGLYVSNLRFEPGYPRTNDQMTFYATIINQTGKDQHYPVCVEIYRPGAAKPFGTSSCDTSTIVPNSSEVLAGYWTGTGIKECIPVQARPILREQGEGETRLPFTRLNGTELWIDFSICP